MNNKDFIAMSWEERIDYFRGVGLRTTFSMAMKDDHPLCMVAIEDLDEKNE